MYPLSKKVICQHYFFVIFKMAATNMGFSKILNFNNQSAVCGKYVSSCQISSKSVQWLQRFGVLTFFKMVAVHRLGFLIFKFFNALGG